jgi:hypothetical protein
MGESSFRRQSNSVGSRNCGVDVSTGDDVLIASVDELMGTFRAALLALVPVADRAKLGWRENEANPAWERLAVCAYEAFVGGPVSTDRDRRASNAPLARYDIDIESYREKSWIGVGDSIYPGSAMVRVVTVVAPFDSVEVVDVDLVSGRPGDRQLIRWDEARFFFVRRSADGALTCVSSVVAEE